MEEKWIGITVSNKNITLVRLDFEEDECSVVTDETWSLQQGERPDAYDIMYRRVSNYVNEQAITDIVIKGSAVSLGGTKRSHLEAAELRGVVIAAAASANTNVYIETKSHLSRTFGKRKADDYIKDEDFWDSELDSTGIRKKSRETALLILAVRKHHE